MKVHVKSYLGVVAGLLTIALVAILRSHPEVVEVLYYQGLYPVIRSIYDYTLGRLPFAMMYVALPFLIYWIVRQMRLRLAEDRHPAACLVLGLSNAAGWLIAFFYWSWGFNYSRPSLEVSLGLPQGVAVDTTMLIDELYRVTDLYEATRQAIDTTYNSLDLRHLPLHLEREVRADLTAVLRQHHWPITGQPRVRVLRPAGSLLRISTAGVYLPFAMEGHIDAGLHPIQYPYTMAHEMSHGYGFTDEGVCNFLALLACMRSDLPIVRYSALRAYWIYLARDVRRLDADLYRRCYDGLSQAVQNDYQAVIDQMDRYPDILPAVRDFIYDTYLKTNGVQAGLDSYGQVVGLSLSYQEKYGVLD